MFGKMMTKKKKCVEERRDTKVVVYSATSGVSCPVAFLKGMLVDLFSRQSLDLARRLFIRDLTGMYRKNILGYLWVLIPPLVTSLIWVFLNKNDIVSVSVPGMPYAVFAVVGNIIWQSFTVALQTPIMTVQSAQAMLTKVNFGRESLLVSGFWMSMLNAFVPLVLLIPLFIFYEMPFNMIMLLTPLGIFMVLLFGFTLGVLAIPFGLLYQDIGRAIPIVVRFWFFLTPVVYSIPHTGMASILKYNPLTPIMNVTRGWITGQCVELSVFFWVVAGGTLALLFMGLVIYRLAMPILIERMSP